MSREVDPKAIEVIDTVILQPWAWRKDERTGDFILYQCAMRDGVIYEDEIVQDNLCRIPPQATVLQQRTLADVIAAVPAMVLSLQGARAAAGGLHTDECMLDGENIHVDTCDACDIITACDAALQHAFGPTQNIEEGAAILENRILPQ